jgi:flagellar protein FliO/FliZ
MSTLAIMLAVAPAVAPPQFNAGVELLRVIFSLLGIIALIVVAGWVSRRLQRRPGTSGRRIRCVESFAVGTRERLLLVDADGKRLLIGMGTGGMHTLHVYDGDATAPLVDTAPERLPLPSFSDLLARWKRGA